MLKYTEGTRGHTSLLCAPLWSVNFLLSMDPPMVQWSRSCLKCWFGREPMLGCFDQCVTRGTARLWCHRVMLWYLDSVRSTAPVTSFTCPLAHVTPTAIFKWDHYSHWQLSKQGHPSWEMYLRLSSTRTGLYTQGSWYVVQPSVSGKNPLYGGHGYFALLSN